MRIVAPSVAVALVVFACKGEPPAAQVLDSRSDKPEVVQLSGLFKKLIGRELGIVDNRNKINGHTIAELQQKSYAEQIDNILQSKQFHEEGFWHFHEDRLLLGRETVSAEESDRASLKLEMADVARSDNYWNILTYRDRWLSLRELKLNACSDYIDTESDAYYPEEERPQRQREDQHRCSHFLQAVMHPQVEHEYICTYYQDDNGEQKQKARKFTESFKSRCCPSVGESIAAQHKNMCNQIDEGYSNLFGENFCAVAAKPISDNCAVQDDADDKGDDKDNSPPSPPEIATLPPLPFTWDENKFYQALSLYISLHLSEDEDANLFIAVSVPQNEEIIYRRDKETNASFIKATFPADLQGIHASPYWLSKHYTSVSNQHLHRARIIYHSWFCEGISPDQVKAEGEPPNPQEVSDLAKYFPAGNQHVQKYSNCFDCHKVIQPLANYFGRLSAGQRYDDDRRLKNAAKFLQEELVDGDKSLPLREDIGTGYYSTAAEMFQVGGLGHNKPGMAGLADLLDTHRRVKYCVVRYTWNKNFWL